MPIEEESYVPLTLFRYGRNDAAYQVLADLSRPQKARREYPEVSYSVIEALVSEVMGIQPSHKDDTFDILTLSRLPTDHDRAALSAVSIRKEPTGHHAYRHIINPPEECVTTASAMARCISGKVSRLHVNGTTFAANHSTSAGGTAISWIDVTVPSGATRVISRYTDAQAKRARQRRDFDATH